MHKFPEEVPKENQIVIAYSENESYITKYKKYLTWSGYKLKFVNLLGSGFAVRNIIGWNGIPTRMDKL